MLGSVAQFAVTDGGIRAVRTLPIPPVQHETLVRTAVLLTLVALSLLCLLRYCGAAFGLCNVVAFGSAEWVGKELDHFPLAVGVKYLNHVGCIICGADWAVFP